MIINGDAYFKVTTRFKVRSIATIITRALTLKSHASTKIMFSKGEKEKVGGGIVNQITLLTMVFKLEVTEDQWAVNNCWMGTTHKAA